MNICMGKKEVVFYIRFL